MNPVIGLSLGRMAVGVVALARPDVAAKMLQLDTAANPQLPYLTRLFGSREVAIGLVTLLSRGSARRNLTAAGMLVDGADAAVAYVALRDGTVSRKAAVSMMVPALGAVGSAVAALRR